MAWNLTGEMVETCSCNMLCPCWYGVKELMIADQGWCGSPILFRIFDGQANGVDLGGLNVVMALFTPGPTMLDGGGTARLYVDDRVTDEQASAIETIFQAKAGGPMEVPASLVDQWLSTKRTRIEVNTQEDRVHATIEGAGEIVSQRLVNDAGQKMTMQNAGFMLAFQFTNLTGELAPSDGSYWQDPDLPQTWDSKSGMVGQIAWSAP